MYNKNILLSPYTDTPLISYFHFLLLLFADVYILSVLLLLLLLLGRCEAIPLTGNSKGDVLNI